MPLPSWLAQWLTQLAGLCCAERDALLDIKKALDTGGRVLGSWSSSSCQCSGSWMGVTCTDGRLTALWVAATGVKALLSCAHCPGFWQALHYLIMWCMITCRSLPGKALAGTLGSSKWSVLKGLRTMWVPRLTELMALLGCFCSRCLLGRQCLLQGAIMTY